MEEGLCLSGMCVHECGFLCLPIFRMNRSHRILVVARAQPAVRGHQGGSGGLLSREEVCINML